MRCKFVHLLFYIHVVWMTHCETSIADITTRKGLPPSLGQYKVKKSTHLGHSSAGNTR